ncbi:MAG: polymorphic toxin-type HINT domain-containing protein, partial [bacterium]
GGVYGNGVCFVAGTLIATKDGSKAIEGIEVGDLVLSRNEETGEITYKPVVRTFVTPDSPTIDLTLEDHEGKQTTIGVTPEHPFWVVGQGWVEAGDLLPGDELFTSKGGWLRVSGSTWASESATVYNFEVEGFHTYFAGEAEAWVHNVCDPTKPAREVLPGRLRREFPAEHLDKSLNDIKAALSGESGQAKRSLQKAKKLLEQVDRLMQK